jgi:hypothetical protein
MSFSPQFSTKSSISINQALQTSSKLYNVPAILSKGNGKSKLIFDNDDVPLAQLKKQRCGQKTPTTSLFGIEMASLSITKLQNATPIKGPIYNFLNNPLLGTLG